MENTNFFKKNRATIIFVASGFLGVLLLRFLLSFILENSPSYQRNKAIDEIISNINKNCPMRVDNETQVFRVTRLLNKEILFDLSLTAWIQDSIYLNNIKKSKEVLTNSLLINIRTNPSFEIFRQDNTTFYYQYHDKRGSLVLEVIIKPEQYKTSD